MIPPVANRFVAGESVRESLDHIEALNQQGIGGILNPLGEHYHDRSAADQDTNVYLYIIDQIEKRDLDACISVKPSQIGIGVGDRAFSGNIERIVEHAAADDIFVWIDMEDHLMTDTTLEAYERLAREYDGGIGVCVQTNLKRIAEDLARLVSLPGRFVSSRGRTTSPPISRTKGRTTSTSTTGSASNICSVNSRAESRLVVTT